MVGAVQDFLVLSLSPKDLGGEDRSVSQDEEGMVGAVQDFLVLSLSKGEDRSVSDRRSPSCRQP
jgi:carbon starvation protein CstA